MLTSLRVGLPMKKSVFLLLLGGLNLGFRKAHPFAMASRGAGPSYGNPSPTNSCKTEKNITRQHIERDWLTGVSSGLHACADTAETGKFQGPGELG